MDGVQQGKIIIQSGANVWPHELKTAQSHTAIGKNVELIKRSNVRGATARVARHPERKDAAPCTSS